MTETQTGRLIGYVRVSTKAQDEQLQLDDLTNPAKGNVQLRDIYIDKGVSGARSSRPELDKMLDPKKGVQPGDTIVVYKLDRLGRDTGHVISLLADLRKRGIHVRSIGDGLDTTTDMGEAMMGILAIFAKVELGFIKQRTRSGLASAKAQGRTGGRKRALDTKAAQIAQSEYDKGEKVADIAKTLKVSVPTVYRYLQK